MFCKKGLFYGFALMAFSSRADWVNLTTVNSTISGAWVQLFENRSLTAVDAEALSVQGIRGVLEALSPQIKAQPGYTGVFVANCSLYVNTILERVSCNISSPEVARSVVVPLFTPETRLPWDYAYEITRSHIVLVNVYADWTGRFQLIDEDYQIAAFPRTATCSGSLSDSITHGSGTEAKSSTDTLLASNTAGGSWTHTLSPSVRRTSSETGTNSQSASDTFSLQPSLSLSLTARVSTSSTGSSSGSRSVSVTRSFSRSPSNTGSLSREASQSHSFSLTVSEQPSSTMSASHSSTRTRTFVGCAATSQPMNGLLSAWHRSTGVYDLAVSQTGRYTVSNGVVTDTLTNMQWEQTAGTTPMVYSSVAGYCSGRTTGGLTDWRAPNIVELGTLIDYTTSTAPFLNTTAFPGAPASDYWSGSPDIGQAGYSWFVRSSSVPSYSSYQTTGTSAAVRCVRSCYATPPSSRYTIGSGATTGTVTDNVTGFIWQKVAPTSGGPNGNGTYNQAGAISYCNSLSLGGSGAGTWRLPNPRELQTLVDYSKNYGTLMMDTATFSGEPAKWFWTSSPVVGSSYGWFVLFYLGNVAATIRRTTPTSVALGESLSTG